MGRVPEGRIAHIVVDCCTHQSAGGISVLYVFLLALKIQGIAFACLPAMQVLIANKIAHAAASKSERASDATGPHVLQCAT